MESFCGKINSWYDSSHFRCIIARNSIPLGCLKDKDRYWTLRNENSLQLLRDVHFYALSMQLREKN